MQKTTYLTTLTPLRGIASLFVVIFHCNFLNPFLPAGYTEFLGNAWLWVDFFFILSGFILCYSYGKVFEHGFTIKSYKNYISARFARIYPLHFFTTIWVFICAILFVKLTGKSTEVLNPNALLPCLLLIQSMFSSYTEPPLNSPSWSLSTEWWVYIIFPLLVPIFISLKKNKWPLIISGIVFLYLLIRYVLGPINNAEPTIAVITDFGFIRCLAGFVTGMLIFTMFQVKFAYKLMKHDLFFISISVCLTLVMHFTTLDIVIIVFFPFLLIAGAYNDTKVKKFLDIKALQRIGDWSFSIYLIHVPIIYTIKTVKLMRQHFLESPVLKPGPVKVSAHEQVIQPNYLSGLLMCIIVLVVTISLSGFFYRYLEIPSRNYLNNLFSNKHKKIESNTLKV